MSQGVEFGMDQRVGLGMEVVLDMDLQVAEVEVPGTDQWGAPDLHLNSDHMEQMLDLLGEKGTGLVGVVAVPQRTEAECCQE